MSKGFSATKASGVQGAINNLSKFLKTLDTVPSQVLEESAQTIKAEAIAQAPYKTGTLERSIYATVSKDKRRPGLRVGASAKSPSGYNYAGIQHENTSYDHPVKGKAHYIRDPFNEEVSRLKKRLRKELKITK